METIYNPSSLHFETLKTLIGRMNDLTEEGKDVSSAELLEVLQSWLDAPTKIDQGQLSPYPKSSEYNMAMQEADRAIRSLYSHVKALDGMVSRSKEEHKTEYDRLFGLLGRLHNLYADVESLVFGEGRTRTSSDYFLSDENIDYSRIGGSPLRVEGGTVSLPYATTPILLNQSVTASIIPGVLKAGVPLIGTESNGFAGNNHEVRVIASDVASGVDETGRVSFIGEEDRSADLSAILDQDATTWFEYEKIDMRETEQTLIAQKKNLVYEIAPGKVISHIGKPDDGLKLHLLLTLQKKAMVNELEIASYTPSNYGASEAMVEDILVSDGANPPTSIFERKPLPGERIFRFAPREVKSIQIKFKQDKPYPFDYGHIYYEQLTPTKGQKVFFDKESGRIRAKNPIRLEGPLQEVVDMGYVVTDEKTGTAVSYGEQAYGQARSIGISRTIEKAKGQIDTTKVQMGVQKIEALRYAIGIRDIIIKEASYETEGELVTKPHYYDEPVERITIETDAVMEQDAKKQGANVFYFVSVDDGAEWLPIAPINSNQDKSIPRMYRVGQTKEDTDMPVVETKAPVYSLRFKVVMVVDGVRTQALNETSFRSPQLFSYQAKIETKEIPRHTRMPKLAMPILPKGVGDTFDYVPSDQGSIMPPDKVKEPVVQILALPDWCSNKPMQIPITAEGEQRISKVEIYFDGQLVLSTTPNSLSYKESVNIPTDFFETKSRVVCMVKAYIGDVVSTAYAYIRIIPCADVDVEDKQINVNAGKLVQGQDWIIAGAASSDEKIMKMTLTINDKEYPLSETNVAGIETGKTEVQVTIPYEIWKDMNLSLEDSVYVTLTATGEQDETWSDTDILSVREDEKPVIVTQPIQGMKVTYFKWSDHRFHSVYINNFKSQMNKIIGDDGRGVSLLLGWSKAEGRPLLMVKSGLGETGGIILGGIELTMEVNGEVITSGMVRTHKEDGVSMMEMANEDHAQDLSSFEISLKENGDLSRVARLERMNSWMMPYFNEAVESGLTADSIDCEAYEPEDNIVDPTSIEPGPALCATVVGYLYQRYDRESGGFKLHYKQGDGRHRVMDAGVMLDIDVGFYVNPDGPALSLRTAPAQKFYLSALGVMRTDQYPRALYGQVYLGSDGFDKKDENGLYLGPPKSEAYWVDNIETRGEDEEAPGLTKDKAFLHVAADSSMAYCAPSSSWIDRFKYDLYDNSPPVLTLEPATSTVAWQSLQGDGKGSFNLPYLAKLVDDKGVGKMDIYADGVLIGTVNTGGLQEQYSGNLKLTPTMLTETLPGEKKEADIIFTLDTSGSMTNIINDVKAKLNELKTEFVNSDVDIYMAALGTNVSKESTYSQSFLPASQFNLNLTMDDGGFEAMLYRQIDPRPLATGYTALTRLLEARRPGVRIYHFVITDTYMARNSSYYEVYGPNTDFTKMIDANIQQNISISVAGVQKFKYMYEEITRPTKGFNTTNDSDFKVLFRQLLQKIEQEVQTYADKTVVIQAIGVDNTGNRVTVTHTVTLKDQKNMT